MTKVTGTTERIHWIYRPTGYKETTEFPPTQEGLQKWVSSRKPQPNLLQKSSPTTLVGTFIFIVGIIGTMVSNFKDTSKGTLIGAITTALGGLITALGAFKHLKLQLHSPHAAHETSATYEIEIPTPIQSTTPIKLDGIKVKLSDEEEVFRSKIKASMLELADRIAHELEIDPEQLKTLLPEIVHLNEIKMDFLNTYASRQYYKSLSREVLENHPRQLLELLPSDLKEELFPNGVPDHIQEGPKPNEGGGYIAQYHKVGFVPEAIKNGLNTPEEIGTHEGYHAINAILRTLLAKEHYAAFNSAILEEIYEGISNGRPTSSLASNGFFEQRPFIPSQDLRKKIAEFTISLISKLNRNDPRITKASKAANQIKLFTLSPDGKEALATHLDLTVAHQEFLANVDNEGSALKIITRYIEDELFRYCYMAGNFSPKTEQMHTLTIPDTIMSRLLAKNPLVLPRKAIEFTQKSTRNFPALFEGNNKIALKIASRNMPNTDDKLSYAFSDEEISCQKVSLQNTNVDPNSTETVRAKLEVYELGKKLLELKRQAHISPCNAAQLKNHYSTLLLSVDLLELSESIQKQFNELEANIANDDSQEATELKERLRERKRLVDIYQSLVLPKGNKDDIKEYIHEILKLSKQIVDKYNERSSTVVDFELFSIGRQIATLDPLIDDAINNSGKSIANIVADRAILAEIEATEKQILAVLPKSQLTIFQEEDFKTVRLNAA